MPAYDTVEQTFSFYCYVVQKDFTLQLTRLRPQPTPFVLWPNWRLEKQKIFSSFFLRFWKKTTIEMMQWCHSHVGFGLPSSPLKFIDSVEVEKLKTTKQLMFTARVILVDLKYKMLWCMLEISAVNMPSTEKQVSCCSFICFCFR